MTSTLRTASALPGCCMCGVTHGAPIAGELHQMVKALRGMATRAERFAENDQRDASGLRVAATMLARRAARLEKK